MLNFKNTNTKKAFTMLELVMVIVLLGILAGIAFPRLVATRDDAVIVKGRNEVSTIRSAIISQRSQNILAGQGVEYIDDTNLSSGTTGDGQKLFDGVLPNPIYSKSASGHWTKDSSGSYIYQIGSIQVRFSYHDANGTFDCTHSLKECRQLTE